MNLLIHVENYDREGILPSQLDGIRTLAQALGVERFAFVDATVDGYFIGGIWERFPSLSAFLESVDGPLIVFDVPHQGVESTSLKELRPSPESWLLFGQSMGF